jgi:hypothetical protein
MPDATETPREEMSDQVDDTTAPEESWDTDCEEDEERGTTPLESSPKELCDLQVPGAMIATNLGCAMAILGAGVTILVATAMVRHVLRNAPSGLDTPNLLGVAICAPLMGFLTVKLGYALCARLRLRTSQPLFAGEPLLPRIGSWGVAIFTWTFLAIVVIGGLVLLVAAIWDWLT